jgi:HK97 family phage prohead protease
MDRTRELDLARLADSFVARFGNTPEPIGKPGGPGLWHHKGWQLPPGIQHVRNDLMEKGMPESKATEMAIGIMENWSHGHDGKGHAVSAKVQAEAAATMTEFHALQAKNKATAKRATIATADVNNLPDSAFGYIEPGGSKDSSGKTVPRSLRHFPLTDAAHIRNALSRAPQSPFGDKAMPKIRAAAKKAGIQVADDNTPATAARVSGEIFRYYPLDDIRIMRASEGESSGRVVEAYATVFDEPAEIHDPQGHYMEIIDRTAFDRVLAKLSRSRGGFGAGVRVLFNHGKTMEGQPAPEFQLPIGKPLDIRADGRGLLTRTEYDTDDPFAERVLSKIRAGSITGQSFVGAIERSDPELRGPGDKYRRRSGMLTTVRRMTLGLREYGPVLYGAYTGAEFLGVRMQPPGGTITEDFDEPEQEETVPDMEGDGAGGTPEDVTSARYHQHALYAMRSRELREQKGLVW